jgi:hypothetical protein
MPSNHYSQSPPYTQPNGFQQLPPSQGSMASTQRDVIEEVPLEKVVTSGSATGARKASFNPENPHRHRPHLGRRKTSNGLLPRQDTDNSTDGTLTRMGKVYRKVIGFSVVTRWSIYVLPIALVLSIPIFLGAFVFRNATIQGVKLYWFFSWIEVGMKYLFLFN